MAREKQMWKYLQKRLPKKAHVMRVENKAQPGTPDVYICYRGVSVWLELKSLEGWPVRPQTHVRVPYYTPQQRLWGKMHHHAHGNAYVLLKVNQDWLLIEADRAAEYLGHVPKFMLRDIAYCWWDGLDVKELVWYLFDRNY